MLSSVSDQSLNFSEAEKFVDNNIEDNLKVYSLQPRVYKEINFPVIKYPDKINSLESEKKQALFRKIKRYKRAIFNF